MINQACVQEDFSRRSSISVSSDDGRSDAERQHHVNTDKRPNIHKNGRLQFDVRKLPATFFLLCYNYVTSANPHGRKRSVADTSRRGSTSSVDSRSESEHQHYINSGKLHRNGRHYYEGAVHRGTSPLPHNSSSPQLEETWWYLLCTKCRQKETGPGWEPFYWQRVCPYPFFPTYRHVAQSLCLVLLVLLAWAIAYSFIDSDAAPGGQLFEIAVLVICAYFGGYLFRLFNLPGLVGMLVVGIVYQNIGLIYIHGPYVRLCGVLRKVALVIILTRAGLDLEPGAMKRLILTTLKLGLVPWMAEMAVIAATLNYLFDLPFLWAFMAGSIVAAVSPAVVVACLFRLRVKGYGVAKGIPTVVLAISAIDDGASVAAFGIIHSLMFSEHSLLHNIALGPVSLLGGIGFGALWGLLSRYVPEKQDPFVVPLRILMLLGGGLVAILGSEKIGLGGAGPLAVISAAFVSSWVWSSQGWKIADNPVATAFEIFWLVIEPILFSITGTLVKLNEIDSEIFYLCAWCVVLAAVIRMIVTVLIAFGESFNLKEKCFFAVSLMAKASVQAALGPVAFDTLRKRDTTTGPELKAAEIVMVVCILSIALTAPVGAILIALSGPRLLTKTVPGPRKEWMTSVRPSIRDIIILEEDEEDDENEKKGSPLKGHDTPALSPRTTEISDHP